MKADAYVFILIDMLMHARKTTGEESEMSLRARESGPAALGRVGHSCYTKKDFNCVHRSGLDDDDHGLAESGPAAVGHGCQTD